MDGEDIQTLIETNQPSQIEDIKKKFYEQFNATKDAWLLNGIFDCYVQTSSTRLVEVLVGVREPHDVHLFNKLSDSLRGPSKLQALTLLGHVVRRRPTWLIKIVKHPVLVEILKILKHETDILLLMSALLIIIILLPMIPSLMAQHLHEIFDVFSRLAAWNTNNPNKVPEYNLIHLQVGLCELFNRLYGMYPCNFLYYLRHTYTQRDNLDVFSHTIKPMVFSVRMHPQLVTTSKDAETAASRWMKMEDHDVIVECAKYVLDAARDDMGPSLGTPALRSRSPKELAMALEKSLQYGGKSVASDLVLTYRDAAEWSPSVRCGLNTPPPPESTPTSIPHTPIQQVNYAASASFPSQEGTSPPEAAIEATPETTPIKDLRLLPRQPPAPSSVVRALNHSLSSGGGGLPQKWPGGLAASTSYSQPSSPMKKEPSPFRYIGINQQMTATPPPTFPSESVSSISAFQQPRRDSLPLGGHLMDQTSMSRRIANIVQDRRQNSESFVEKQTTPVSAKPRGSALTNITSNATSATRLPSSPLRVIGSTGLPPESPVPIEPTAPVPGSRDWPITRPTPEKNGFHIPDGHHGHGSLYHSVDSSQEDQEVVEIVRQGEQRDRNESHPVNVQTPQSVSRHCDSVLQEFSVSHNHDQDCEMDGDECLQEQSGSPCASGGLHMPNSVMNFTRRAHRMRYFSQCLPSVHHQIQSDSHYGSTGSSPGNGTSFPSAKVRRTNSCPEIEKTPAIDLKVDCTVEEREEFEDCLQNEDATTPQNSIGEEALVNGCNHIQCRPEMVSEGTQTTEGAPYEHLFMSVFPTMDGHSSSAPSPAPLSSQHETMQTKPENISPQAQLDHFLWSILENRPKSSGMEAESIENKLKEQIMLLNIQLQFERQRREVHAERNRRLLGRSRNNRALEEVKTALKEQLSLLQHELESVNKEVTKQRQDSTLRIQHEQAAVKYWEDQCIQAQENFRVWKAKFEDMEQKFLQEQKCTAAVQKEYQKAQSKLLDISNEKRQAEISAAAAEHLRAETQQLQRELFLAGEQQQRLWDKIQYMTLHHNRPEEMSSVKEAYHEELNTLRQILDTKNSALEAAKARVSELESNATNVALHMNEKKRQLKVVKDEYNDQLQAVESKYQAQKKTNQRLQETNLELLKIIAELKSKRKREGREASASQPAATSSSSHSHRSHPKSPDSVCSDDRLPHSSSPLSESLSSSEGMSLPGILARDVTTIQNLQVIVDQPEHPVEATLSSPPTPTKVTSTTTAVNAATDEG